MTRVYSIFPKRRKRKIFGSNITLSIILINVVVFVLFLILLLIYKENPQFLYDILALKPSNIMQGKYVWTFITSMFMHGGLFHIFANMFSLLFIGSLVERILGPKRYLWFFLISGLFAGIFFVLISLLFGGDFNTYAVGASGALFGLVGLLVLLTPNLSVYVMFIPIPIKMKYAGPGILIVLWGISAVAGGNVKIGNTAHLGGLIAGLGYGIYLKNKYKRKTTWIKNHFN